MNYGYNIGAAGVLTALHRQDVATNNLANIQTVGFKPDTAFTVPRQAVRQEDGLMSIPSNALLERLGAGVLLAPNRTNFKQGAITQSRNPFDLAIEGDGFLTVAGSKGGVGGGAAGDEIRLTRDGRLTMNTEGRLVTIGDGREVLDASGRPITLNPAQDFQVEGDGRILQGGQDVATLGFVDVPNRGVLRKVGDNLFALSAAAASSKVPATGTIRQHAIEESGSDPIRAMMDVQAAADAVGTTSKIMQIHDDLMNRAINTLGRVTA
jgi:flagellar basal-body rod protein FlgF